MIKGYKDSGKAVPPVFAAGHSLGGLVVCYGVLEMDKVRGALLLYSYSE